MKKKVVCTYHTLFLTAIFCIAMAVPNAASQSPPSKTSPSLSVYYEKSTDRITVNASYAPLEKVFELIVNNVALEVEAQDEQLLQTQVSTEIPLQPVEEAIRGLLEDFNTMFFYYDAIDSITRAHFPVLAKVKIISKKEQGALASRPGNSGLTIWQEGNPPGKETHTDQQAGRDATDRYDLEGLFKILKESRSEKERQQAIESLVVLLLEKPDERDHQAFSDILANLKEHAPDQAVVPLVTLLRQPEKNRVFRAMAARALGEIGNEYAVDPLIEAFRDADPLVQTNAANSLARLSNERALRALLSVFNGGDQLLQQSVATALTLRGSNQAKQAFKQMVAVGGVVPGMVPKDAMDMLEAK